MPYQGGNVNRMWTSFWLGFKPYLPNAQFENWYITYPPSHGSITDCWKWSKIKSHCGCELEYHNHRKYSNELSASKIATERIFIDGLARSGNKRKFFKYLRLNTNTEVAALRVCGASGTTFIISSESAEVLASEFASAFTREPDSDLLLPRCIPSLQDIESTPEIVNDYLMCVEIYTSLGPDGLSPYFLKRCADSLAPPIFTLQGVVFQL